MQSVGGQVTRYAKQLGRFVLDFVLPSQCLSCGSFVESSGALCASCWRELTFLSGAHCQVCGAPFSYALSENLICGACMADPPEFDRARAPLKYDEASRHLILAFKHADRHEGLTVFARWMASAGAEIVDQAEMIVPVPLHWQRLVSRRYNQAALLGHRLGKFIDRPVQTSVLERVKATPSQGGLGRRNRFRNMRGAFAVSRTGKQNVKGTHVLLIDDVLTTGATARACAVALKRAGAAKVDLLTLARVVGPVDPMAS